MEGTIIRKHMKISGRVQGVGFRFRASHVARELGITGWVRNEWDGTVELEVQGTQEQIHRLLTMINQGSYINIEGIDTKEIPLEQNEYGFHVR